MEKIKNITLRGTLVARVKVACCKKKNKNYHQKKKKTKWNINSFTRGNWNQILRNGFKAKNGSSLQDCCNQFSEMVMDLCFYFFFPTEFRIFVFFPQSFSTSNIFKFLEFNFSLFRFLFVVVVVCHCVCVYVCVSAYVHFNHFWERVSVLNLLF